MQLAYELVLNRPAEAAEQTEALQYLDAYQSQLQSEGRSPEEVEQLAWSSLSRVLLSSNEFVYVD